MLITASISSYTYAQGAVELNVDDATLFNYLEQLVLPELATNNGNPDSINELPLLKATAIKFLYFFRNQIPDSQVLNVATLMADLLKAESFVIQSYASACLEKMLIKRSISPNNHNIATCVLNDTNVS